MTLRIKGSTVIKGLTSVGWSPNLLFAAGEQGVWYDPSDFTTMFQDTAGTTPVTATGQSVGCILDKRNPSYSVYFNGNSYLSLPNTASVNDFGTGDFTIECWVRVTNVAVDQIFITCASAWSTNVAYDFEVRNTGDLRFFAGNSVPISIASGNGTLVSNTWHHIAVSRSSGSTKMFVDGVQKGNTHTGSVSISNSSSPRIGQFVDGSGALTGYISNLRIVKGTALYTANFTPPTAPLSPVGNTSVLTCGTSWSGNPAIANSNAVADKLNPFNTGTGNHATQSTAANRPTLQIDGNGKYYLSFDGSNDILFCNDTNMPTGDLSVFWGSYLNVDFPAAFPAVASYGVASPSRSVFILYGNPSNIYVSQYGESLFVSASKTTAYVASLNRIGTAYNLRKNGGAGSASQSMATNTAVYGANGFGLGGNGAGLLGVSPFLSGRIYGLIIRGAASTASQIAMTETYMNSKTAAY